MVTRTAIYYEARKSEIVTINAKNEEDVLEKLEQELAKRIKNLENEGWKCKQEEPTIYTCVFEKGGFRHELTVAIELVE
jgi:molybdopterin converting factor small subunit